MCPLLLPTTKSHATHSLQLLPGIRLIAVCFRQNVSELCGLFTDDIESGGFKYREAALVEDVLFGVALVPLPLVQALSAHITKNHVRCMRLRHLAYAEYPGLVSSGLAAMTSQLVHDSPDDSGVQWPGPRLRPVL